MVSHKHPTLSLTLVLLKIMCLFFPLVGFKILDFTLIFSSFNMAHFCLYFHYARFQEFLEPTDSFDKILSCYHFENFFCPVFFFRWSGNSIICIYDLVSIFHTAAVPNTFGTRDQFCGRQFFHRQEWRGMVWGWLKHITFIVYIISNLMPPLVWQEVMIHDPGFGDPCHTYIFLNLNLNAIGLTSSYLVLCSAMSNPLLSSIYS